MVWFSIGMSLSFMVMEALYRCMQQRQPCQIARRMVAVVKYDYELGKILARLSCKLNICHLATMHDKAWKPSQDPCKIVHDHVSHFRISQKQPSWLDIMLEMKILVLKNNATTSWHSTLSIKWWAFLYNEPTLFKHRDIFPHLLGQEFRIITSLHSPANIQPNFVE